MFNIRSAHLMCCCINTLEQYSNRVFMIGSILSCNQCDESTMILAEDNVWESTKLSKIEGILTSDTARFSV